MPKNAINKSEDLTPRKPTTKQAGDAAEDRAWRYLQAQGLKVLQRNYRTPGRGGGEIDLIMQDVEGTVVFVEVRHRSRGDHGGAASSVTWTKQQRIVFAARHFLLRLPRMPACRFDVVSIDGTQLAWYRGAFDGVS
ncbi:MAG: YraN family protein [Limnohabitans sp.]|jgi:putative endonuclease